MQEKLRCPICQSGQIRYRLKTRDKVCNKCGNIYKEEPKEVEEVKD